jgi:hypothetical protein
MEYINEEIEAVEQEVSIMNSSDKFMYKTQEEHDDPFSIDLDGN